MISHEHRCIFIHIPKCAGTSIETALGHSRGAARRVPPDHRTVRRIEVPFLTLAAFSSAENLGELQRRLRHPFRAKVHPRNKTSVTRQQYASYFKFSFVRNPWARAYSWYWNVVRDDVHRRLLGIGADISFADFMKRHAGKDMLRPQTYWLKNFKGAIPLDFIGRFENLEADFAASCRQMSIPPLDLPHTRKSDHGGYREAYDQELIDLVSRIYREEIDLFGYSF
jgi:hypothetical protein